MSGFKKLSIGLKIFAYVYFAGYVIGCEAATIDKMVQDSNHCVRYFPYFEHINKIPKNLLKAVSLTESGRWHKELGRHVPWPWAVNVEGKSYYYDSKFDAVKAVREFLDAGYKSIDIGCMQINLRNHPKAFKTIEEAFEPRSNIAYAANFLKSKFTKHSNWHNAVAAYHSETQELGTPYAYKVINNWYKDSNQPMPAGYKHNNRINQPSAKLNRITVQRRKSSIFIRVNNGQEVSRSNNIPKQEGYSVVENISQNALANFNKNKEIKNPDSVIY